MSMQWRNLLLATVMWLGAAAAAGADTVYLKNGRSFECVVVAEDKSTVELDIGFGITRIRVEDIERIERANPQEHQQLREYWEQKRQVNEIDRQQRAEEERQRLETAPRQVAYVKEAGHMIVEAVLNNRVKARLLVDTGASVILLHRDIADQLGLFTGAGADKPVGGQAQVADGRKVNVNFVLLDSVIVQGVEARSVATAALLEDVSDIPFDGLLGMSFLGRFNFSINQKENKLILEKNQQ